MSLGFKNIALDRRKWHKPNFFKISKLKCIFLKSVNQTGSRSTKTLRSEIFVFVACVPTGFIKTQINFKKRKIMTDVIQLTTASRWLKVCYLRVRFRPKKKNLALMWILSKKNRTH